MTTVIDPMSFTISGLYAITPDEMDTAKLVACVEAAIGGGARIVQYRNKLADRALRQAQAQALLTLCRRHHVPLIVNDDVELACAIDADGVHLGASDGELAQARQRLGRDKLLGASCYNRIDTAHAAQAAGASYVAFGSAYSSGTKPGAVRAPAALFTQARRELTVPIVAIGGIDRNNARELIGAGADALAIIGAVFGSDSPATVTASARAIASLFDKDRSMSSDSSDSSTNARLFERAQRVVPAGVNSPVRAFRAVGGTPRFITNGKGARVTDADGRTYIDYVCSWGPLILGHAHPAVVEAVQRAAAGGLSYGMPTEVEVELVERLCQAVPSMAMARLVSSGTEATMSALRLARGFTGRSRIIKFEGCYHGHADALLVKAGSGALTFGNPSSAGVPPETAQHTTVLTYNDTAQLEETFHRIGNEIGAVIVEPVAGNMNLIPPKPGYLQSMRALCTQYGAVLIFDEVMTGFRVHPGGAQALYGITPDLTTLGKVIGGGMPVGAFGGRRDIMQHIAPLGPVYQAGTLSGNPVAVAAGLATLAEISRPGFYDALFAATTKFIADLNAAARRRQVPFAAVSIGSMFGLYFRATPPESFAEVMQSDQEAFKRFFHASLDGGVHYAPSAFEAGFTSSAHGPAEFDETVRLAERIFASIRESAG